MNDSKFENYLKISGIQTFPENFNLYDETDEKGIVYHDPDAENPKLYDDLSSLFLNRKLPNGDYLELDKKYLEKGKCEIRALICDSNSNYKYEFYLSSDYIGVSKNIAKNKKLLTDEQIICKLETSRTIGGHMLFPKSFRIIDTNEVINSRNSAKTINQLRGISLNDRFDLTLLDIKNFYENGFNETYMNNTFESYSDWFNEFVSWEEFIRFFYLEDFLSEDLSQVKNLLNGDYYNSNEFISHNSMLNNIPKDTKKYKEYFINSNSIILNRTRKLTDILS